MGEDRRVEILNTSLIVVLNMFVGPENGSPTATNVVLVLLVVRVFVVMRFSK